MRGRNTNESFTGLESDLHSFPQKEDYRMWRREWMFTVCELSEPERKDLHVYTFLSLSDFIIRSHKTV